jgi:transcriptional regulator with XRE-family HTH domain
MDHLPLVNYWAHFVYSYRRLHTITQDQLAERLGVSQQTVSRWEAGQQIPDPASQAKLRKVLGEADLNSTKNWIARVRRAAGFEILFDRELTVRSVSAAMAEIARILPEDMIGMAHDDLFPKPRPAHIERLAQEGFFDGKIVHSKFTIRSDLGPRSGGYHADVWPALTSDGGVLMHASIYPFQVEQAPGAEGMRSEDFVIEQNDLVGNVV